ncbi:MAG: hypothetical protein AVDCRST_MAG73-697 [uncultured Thermomicrobiales bacterium]|uniref:ABC transporter substrate-binding protein PnrA-like domain-containing protein n=1 Tax=uncultured Thermomicrobiales bacterium TaxID=1645740 RepID=A0A6J4TP28_9BACT|nr:MAG: hypothetical protein AVDCRST_MAG73-697 [uncultured Thermomicrobiales bacterium]
MSRLGSLPRLFVLIGLILGGAASPVAIRAQDATPGATPTVVNPVEKVALVTPESRTNQGWDQQAADGIEAVAKRRGIEAIVEENAGYEIEPLLADLADQDVQLVICHASGYQTVCPEFAAEEGIPVAVVENPNAVAEDLVSDIETEAQEIAYLAGVLAGRLTRSGTVGVVVSDEPPTWNYMTVGFAEGLKATKPDAQLVYSVIGVAAYGDAAGGKRVTDQVLAAGADVVFGMGDGSTFGMIEAIRAHNAENPDDKALFIDVIGDKSQTVEDDLLLTSVLFDFTVIYEEMIRDLETDEFGKVYTLSVENKGVRLLDLPQSVPAEVVEAVARAEAGILDGSIAVSAVPDADGVRATLDELFPG